MSSHSRKGAPGNDSFVEKLGDRLSADGERKVLPLRRPEASRPRMPSGEHHAVVPPSEAFPPPPEPFKPGPAHSTDPDPMGFEQDESTLADPAPPLGAQSDIHQVPMANGADDVLEGEVPYVEHPGDDPFAQFEDELDGESTRIDAQHLLAEQTTHILEDSPDPPFLEVASGKDAGKQFVLNPGETTVGRSIDNDVILTDIAVSRRHFKILAQDDGTLRLHDLGSGNGTQLNGRRVYDSPLSEGDRIECGETVLVVRVPSEMAVLEESGVGLPTSERSSTDEEAYPSLPPPATMGMPTQPPGAIETTSFVGGDHGRGVYTDYIQSPEARQGTGVTVPRGWLLSGILVSGLLIALLGALVTAMVLRSGEPETPTVVAVPAAGASGDDFASGVRAYAAHHWDDAIAAFTRASAAAPTDVRAAAYLRKARAAKDHVRALDTARAALESTEEGALDRAQAALDTVPVTSPLRDEAATLRERVQALRRPDEPEQAEVAEAGADEAPEREEHSGRERPNRAQRVARARTRREPERRRETAPVRREATVMREARPRRETSSSGVEARVLAAYRQGNFAAAAEMARSGAENGSDSERRSLLRLAGRINDFATAYQQARSAGFAPTALRAMQRAVVEDERISHGYYGRQINPRLVVAHLAQARSAFQHHNTGAGCQAVRQALLIDSHNGDARRMSDSCESQARSIFADAQRQERSNRARAIDLYGQVQTMLPPNHALARRAYQRKNELARSARVDEDE